MFFDYFSVELEVEIVRFILVLSIFNLQYVRIVIISESRRSGISYNISIRVKMRFFVLVRSANDDTIPFIFIYYVPFWFFKLTILNS